MCACADGFVCSLCREIDEELARMDDSEPRESELWMLEPNGARPTLTEPGITRPSR